MGPDSFRRFVKQIGSLKNFEYDVNIKEFIPEIADYGNIMIEDKPSLEDLQNKLCIKVKACLKRENKVFIIGGSRDIFDPISRALQFTEEGQTPKNNLFISINHSLDTKPLL